MKQLVLLILYLPVLAWSLALTVFNVLALSLPSAVLGLMRASSPKQSDESRSPRFLPASEGAKHLFNRLHDVSKIEGCFTRGIHYNWSIFLNYLKEIEAHKKPLNVIDFGAGSLRDTWEMIARGHRVASVDIDKRSMMSYGEHYDWKVIGESPQLHSLDEFRSTHPNSSADLVIAFDVIEHARDLPAMLDTLKSKIAPGGLIFASVPNGKSLPERWARLKSQWAQRKGAIIPEGIPHQQFHDPEEWDYLFQQNGFLILKHTMAIGPIANNYFNAIVWMPIHEVVLPVTRKALRLLRVRLDERCLIPIFFPPWIMVLVDRIDEALRRRHSSQFGWNLVILKKA